MKKTILSLGLSLTTLMGISQEVEFKTKFENAIPVLNMGTFHMGYSNDARTTEFDEHNQENIRQVHEIAAAIAAFKPTVIIVEMQPKYNAELQKSYEGYLANPKIKFQSNSEIDLLAFEVGRLSGAKKIYGIDYKEGYNYMIGNSVKRPTDTSTCDQYEDMMNAWEAKYPEDKMPLLEALRINNHQEYLDYMINVNADMLTYISSKGKAEGADEAAKFYHRNLVMYSNLNQVPLTKDDRVFILMGTSHTAFFADFMRRSPKYQLVNVLDYLK